jgi:hypothetical protein
MINAIIFSKNRASQLDCLLRSIHMNCKIFDNICVIYKYTSNLHKQAYDKIKKEHDYVLFQLQDSFTSNVNNLIYFDKTCFLVDDLIFYRPIEKHEKESLFLPSKTICISLRLGLNLYNAPHNYVSQDGAILYEWQKETKNFSYPMSLDGHIFTSDDIKKAIKHLVFNNPNQFESRLQAKANRYYDKVKIFKTPLCFSNVINRVSDTSNCSYGEKFPYDVDSLAKIYLDDQVIDYDSMDFTGIRNCHWEVELKFKKC